MKNRYKAALDDLIDWKSWSSEDYLDFLQKHYYTVEEVLKEKIINS